VAEVAAAAVLVYRNNGHKNSYNRKRKGNISSYERKIIKKLGKFQAYDDSIPC
jgi:hypothetical protein